MNGSAVASAVRRARSGVRRTFQRPQVFGRLTVADNVLTALETPRLFRDLRGGRVPVSLRERVDEVLSLCGLSAVRDSYAAALPVGQRRLVDLARALAAAPSLLLLDEPTSGLAGQAARLGEIIASLSTTVLLVEHDVAFVMGACDRLVVLDLGKVIAEGSPAEVRDDPLVRTAYLG